MANGYEIKIKLQGAGMNIKRLHKKGAALALTGALIAAMMALAACAGSAPQDAAQSASSTTQSQTSAAPAAAPTTAPAPTQPPADTPAPAAAATAVPSKPAPEPEPEVAMHAPIVSPATGDEPTVPEITGIASWINSDPFTFESQRGNVVLVDFWTYTCVNCIRTLPYLKAWHEKYADAGLVIVGVHTPEFEFEKDRENVVNAADEFGIEWAIAQDNDFGTWRAFRNRYWPAKYLVDKDGLIRYTHFGEGAYDETELWIRGLLEETGADLSAIPANTVPEPRHAVDLRQKDRETGLTRELYAGYERNYGALLSSTPYVLHREYYEEEGQEILYTDPGDYRNHFLYLQGLWRNDAERLVHARETEDYEDYLAVKFNATSVNAVMAPVNGNAYQVRVTLDGQPIAMDAAGNDVEYDADGNAYVRVDQARMYNIVNLSEYGGHELKLSSNSAEFSLFAYTFGAYDGGEPAPTGPNG